MCASESGRMHVDKMDREMRLDGWMARVRDGGTKGWKHEFYGFTCTYVCMNVCVCVCVCFGMHLFLYTWFVCGLVYPYIQ